MKDYTALLLQQKERVLHTQDLAVLWKIYNKNTLHTTIKRYCQRGILQRIYKGMYSTVPIKELHPWTLGIKALHQFAYISCETILTQCGWVSPFVMEVTMVSSASRHFEIGSYSFRSRKLQDRFLFQATGIEPSDGVLKASPERAMADLLYFNPNVHIDAEVPWNEIKKMQQNIGYPLTPKRYVDSKTSRRRS